MGFNVDTTSDLSQSELEEVVDLYDVGYPGAGMNYDLLSSNQDNPVKGTIPPTEARINVSTTIPNRSS
ncbi:hypothetical protein HRED_06817 [Candidatus Haloredivivus sp. G17]|nr:hypothetical protein HRED_06817 [Candidatus Haloredivivus sp. G17]